VNVLIRLSSEITTKAPKTRKRFMKELLSNMRKALASHGLSGQVVGQHSRVLAQGVEPEALEVLGRVFGVHSMSPCVEFPSTDMDEIAQHALKLMGAKVKGNTYAVRARVRDPRVRYGSMDLTLAVAAPLNELGKVNLDHPDVTVQLEVRDGRTLFYTDRIPGVGGTPLGRGGRALVLLSAGYDSAVAAHGMMTRGVRPDFISFRLGGESHERAVLSVANRLAERWFQGRRTRLWVVPFEDVVEQIRERVEERYRQLALKRAMYRIAEVLAFQMKHDALVTGESIGQVSSQTLRNLRGLTQDQKLPVLRPLLTTSKEEIIERSRKIGTEHLSAGVEEYCALGVRPAVSASYFDIKEQEDRLDLDEVGRLRAAEFFDLPAGALPAEAEDVFMTERAEGLTVLDLRAPPARAAEPIEDAKEVDPIRVLEQPAILETGAEFLVVCDSGPRSVWFARRLRGLGFRAWAWRRT